MLKKPDVLEKNKFHIRVQHLQIYQNQIVLSLSFFCVAQCNLSSTASCTVQGTAIEEEKGGGSKSKMCQ